MVMTTMKQKIQLPEEAMALAWARTRRGAISAEYKNGPPTQANPKKELKTKRNAAPAICSVRPPVDKSAEMTTKESDIPAAVIMKIFRRPTRSMKRRERQEHMAYSVPTQAASK
jgi:hypothetical protein